MAEETENKAQEKTVFQDLRGSGLFYVIGAAVGIVVLYLTLIVGVLTFTSSSVEKVGQFGDSFGALTSLLNALAFAAVVATVVLQTKELRENRIQMIKQAEAQEAWANAAARQIELTKQLEAIRIRPFIKAEWSLVEGNHAVMEFWVRNVGLGVALLKGIDLRVRASEFGSVYNHNDANAHANWKRCIDAAAGGNAEDLTVRLHKLDDLNRVLAPNETQALISVSIAGPAVANRQETIRHNFAPVIHFHSVGGESLSTLNQFDSMR